MSFQILLGHVLDRLREMPASSVHCVVTSVPYLGLRDYSAASVIWRGDPLCDHDWSEIVQPAANGLINNSMQGDTLSGNSATRSPKCSDFCVNCNAWRGSLGMEPTLSLYLDHIVTVFAGVWQVLRNDGTLWINVGDAYVTKPMGNGSTFDPKYNGRNRRGNIPSSNRTNRPADFGPQLKHKDRLGLPHRIAFALQDWGWYWRDEIVWAKTAAMPGSQRDRTTTAHEFLFLFTKQPKYFYDLHAISEPVTGNAHPRGSGINPRARNGDGRSKQNARWAAAIGSGSLVATRTKRSVWTINPQPFVAELCSACDAYYHNGPRSFSYRCESCESSFKPVSRKKACPTCNEALRIKPICECGRWDAWVSHYAAFPEELPRLAIQAGTSEFGCCAVCGAPWRRQVEKYSETNGHRKSGRYAGKGVGIDVRHAPDQGNRPPNGRSLMGSHSSYIREKGGNHNGPIQSVVTIGWEPTCKHADAEIIPCTVLDLFSGTGRSGVATLKLGRHFIGIDIKPEYVSLATHYITEETKGVMQVAPNPDLAHRPQPIQWSLFSITRGVNEAEKEKN